MFTFGTAIARLSNGPTSAFKPGITADQKLQRLNEVLEEFFDLGTWRGVHAEIEMTTTLGVLTVPREYQRLDGLGIPSLNINLGQPKSQQWAYQRGGPGIQDWGLYGELVYIDMGDVNGTHQYQVTGSTVDLDALTFKGLARKRYVWQTDTGAECIPDSFQALSIGVRALGMRDEGANNPEARAMMDEAISVLNGNLGEFEPEERQVVVSRTLGFGSVPFVH